VASLNQPPNFSSQSWKWKNPIMGINTARLQDIIIDPLTGQKMSRNRYRFLYGKEFGSQPMGGAGGGGSSTLGSGWGPAGRGMNPYGDQMGEGFYGYQPYSYMGAK